MRVNRGAMVASTIVLALLLVMVSGVAGAATISPAAAAGGAGSGSVPTLPTEARACGVPAPGHASCKAIELLDPSSNWHPGPAAHGPGGGGGSTVSPPSGYYPADLQSAYGLANAEADATGPGPSAPTVAIVDAYNDPNAESDLATYRSTMRGATDPSTGLTDGTIPPLCSTTTTTSGCVRFTQVNQSGGTSLPKSNTGWSEEISVDVDMISALCPACNIVLVEASSDSFSNLATAVSYAKSLHPAAVTNSYGGNEFSSETSYNSTYAATSTTSATAVTVASGDSGYGVEFPAASPNVTAVGGTALNYNGSGSTLVWNQSVWSDAGSGCSSYEPMPTWQDDQGVYSLSSDCTGRQVADVSAVADPSTGVAVYDSYKEPGWMVFGGTSVATQILGGIYGLAANVGSIDPFSSALYPDTGSTTGSTPGLTPVTTGSTASCGDYLCNAADSLSSGYNGPTGLGTPDGVSALLTSTSAPTTGSLSFSPTSASLTAGGATGPITVDLSTAAPSGGVSITLASTSSTGGFSTSSSGSFSSTMTLSVGSGTTASAPFYYTDTTAGTPTITATAPGWSQASMSVTVNPASSTMSVTVSAGSVVKRGPNYHVPLTVSANTSNGSGIGGASVVLDVYAGSCSTGTLASSTSTTTGSNGQVTVTFVTRTVGSWCALATVSATGYSTTSGETSFST